MRDIGPDLVDDAFEVYKELLGGFLPTFSVECRSVAKRGRSESDTPPNPVQCLLDADDVALLLVQLDRRDLETEIIEVIIKLQAEASVIDIVAFESFFLPLLAALIASVQWTPEQVTRYRRIFRKTLQLYATRVVQLEPQPGNWTHPPRGCGCHHCRQLDFFLLDAEHREMRFAVSNAGDRCHLHQRLDRTGIRHDTDRTGGMDTLVVTKPATPAFQKHEEWRMRFEKAEESIGKLDRGVLWRLLGEDFEYLTELQDVRRGREGLPSARAAVRRPGINIVDLS